MRMPLQYANFETKKETSESHMRFVGFLFLKVRLAAHVSNGCKSRIRPVVGRI